MAYYANPGHSRMKRSGVSDTRLNRPIDDGLDTPPAAEGTAGARYSRGKITRRAYDR